MQSQVEASECDSDSDSDSYLDDHSDRSSDVAARVPESSEDDSNEKSDSDGGKIPQPIVEVALLNEHYSGVLVDESGEKGRLKRGQQNGKRREKDKEKEKGKCRRRGKTSFSEDLAVMQDLEGLRL